MQDRATFLNALDSNNEALNALAILLVQESV